MKRKIIFGVIFVAITIVIGIFGLDAWSKTDWYVAEFGRRISTEKGPDGVTYERWTAPKRDTKGKIVSLGDGWSQYTSDISDKWGLAFSYPSNWELKEKDSDIFLRGGERLEGGQILEEIQLAGDGYSVSFNNIGREVPVSLQTTTSEYVINGKSVRVLEEPMSGGHLLLAMSVCGISLEIIIPEHGRDVANKIMSSVVCSEDGTQN
jgi:hypothetical protein